VTFDGGLTADAASRRLVQPPVSMMPTFQLSLVSPEKFLFPGEVDQVDLPGVEGDFGVLAGHAPILTILRPGIVTVRIGSEAERFVILGGIAEFSEADLTILADHASPVDEFDLPALKAQIEEMGEKLRQISAGEELDRAIARLDHYKSIYSSLVPTTAF
jgi:F-type H+-transporting ATPase subunit epsilon